MVYVLICSYYFSISSFESSRSFIKLSISFILVFLVWYIHFTGLIIFSSFFFPLSASWGLWFHPCIHLFLLLFLPTFFLIFYLFLHVLYRFFKLNFLQYIAQPNPTDLVYLHLCNLLTVTILSEALTSFSLISVKFLSTSSFSFKISACFLKSFKARNYP